MKLSRMAKNYRRRQSGISLIEILISLGIGAFMLLGIIGLVAGVSSTRTRISTTFDQTENGRYALQVIGEDVALAGYFGPVYPALITPTPARTSPDPCATLLADLDFSYDTSVSPAAVEVPLALNGYKAGVTLPTCASDAVSGSEAIVIRRVETESIATPSANIVNTSPLTPHLQISNCTSDAAAFVFDTDKANFILKEEDCGASTSPAWPYLVRTYFISSCEDCSGGGDGRPTLKMVEYKNGASSVVPVASGVEDMHFVYGLDLDGDGAPDCFTDDPAAASAPTPACDTTAAGWGTAVENWQDVAAVKVYLLVREESPTMTESATRTFDMGRGTSVTKSDRYRRKVFSAVVTVPNISGPRE